MQWTINQEGKVKRRIVTNTIKNSTVTDCVMRTISRIRFKKPEAGICVIQWPFVFAELKSHRPFNQVMLFDLWRMSAILSHASPSLGRNHVRSDAHCLRRQPVEVPLANVVERAERSFHAAPPAAPYRGDGERSGRGASQPGGGEPATVGRSDTSDTTATVRPTTRPPTPPLLQKTRRCEPEAPEGERPRLSSRT